MLIRMMRKTRRTKINFYLESDDFSVSYFFHSSLVAVSISCRDCEKKLIMMMMRKTKKVSSHFVLLLFSSESRKKFPFHYIDFSVVIDHYPIDVLFSCFIDEFLKKILCK